MPVLTKEKHKRLQRELNQRFDNLTAVFNSRELTSGFEGTGSNKRSWVNRDAMCATKGTDTELRMAVDDFKTILNEIRKL